MRICKVLAVSFFVLAGGKASSAELSTGSYRCSLSGFHLGDIEIDGDVYRGPAFDGNFKGDYPYEIMPEGAINWGGPLGGITSDGNKVVSSILTNAGDGRTGFDIMIQNARGNFQTVSCSPG